MKKIQEKDKEVVKNIGIYTFTKLMAGAYNSLCPGCRLKVIRLAKRGKRDYYRYLCNVCKVATAEKLKPYTEGEGETKKS